VGSLVQVPFHGRRARGWVLGATDDIPPRMLNVAKRVSPIRFFSATSLELLRWVSERYVSPLAAVIVRSHPPRVASEEEEESRPERDGARTEVLPPGNALVSYRSGAELMDAIRSRACESFVVRPAPEDEQAVVVDAVGAALAAGLRAIVLVPEASPLPATAAAIEGVFGDRVGRLLGGDRRTRFRTWLDVQSGRYDVVVGTRPIVFAPIHDLGLVVVSRESHAAHREDRAPYYHVRDVAIERARIESAVCVLSAFCPSSEAAALGLPEVAPASRRWPPVEVVRPGPEGRAPRLLRALREVRRAFLYSPLPGYGIAAVCRACGEPATCAACGGSLRAEGGMVRCAVCEAPGRCRRCGAADFGIRRGGEERVEEWASAVATVPVRRVGPSGRARLPRNAEVLIGGADDVRDLGPGKLDLVGILDADLADRRPGLTSRERALATWLEAAAWAAPAGRVIVQSNRAADPAVQALVRGDPARFHVDEARRRAAAGFPVGVAVFRVAGDETVVKEIEGFAPVTMLVTGTGERTVCLLALDPRRVPAFGVRIRELAAAGAVRRVEAEPHL
jgi:primosomal protein N' (replication factor Y) (superfamily II helicase)